ncbi:MAG TPA: LLM class flavin-dependent oxidoreductase [Ktedonobacteraceae bacterium]|nr:LLM class flavin-dependent oxidoreductase [Ktedonobacteraceae bacterium]
MEISLYLEGQNGLTWDRWKRFVSLVEPCGFDGLFRSDHFTGPTPPDKNSLEMIVSLTYLADHTRHIHFGPLVAPVSIRHPVLLARQAAAIDDLSGGRMILGVGAGWEKREHQLFGFERGPLAHRMARLEEALEVMTRLLQENEPVTYEGSFYQLHDAMLLPRPQRPGGPPILIGGNRPTILPLVARYARVWNALAISPQAFRESCQALDMLLRDLGRKPGDVKRTMSTSLNIGRTMEELNRSLQWRFNVPEYAELPLDEFVETLHATRHALVGTPDQVIAQIHRFMEAGVEEIMLQWWNMDDTASLHVFAEDVLSRIRR